jgi:hypothetical protein
MRALRRAELAPQRSKSGLGIREAQKALEFALAFSKPIRRVRHGYQRSKEFEDSGLPLWTLTDFVMVKSVQVSVNPARITTDVAILYGHFDTYTAETNKEHLTHLQGDALHCT